MNSNTAICKRLACGDSLKVAQNAKLKTLPNSSGLKLPRLFLFPLISTFNLITIFFFLAPYNATLKERLDNENWGILPSAKMGRQRSTYWLADELVV